MLSSIGLHTFYLAQLSAGLNSAAILGIFLAVAGAGLYFLRSFRPELSRDQDIFFSAVGLLSGIILLFNGWRLDPILQFNLFLIAGVAVAFAVETIRLRGVTNEQAKRSAPTVDRDRRASRVYRAELDEIEPYDEDETEWETTSKRRLRGSPDVRSSRSEMYEEEEERRPRSRTSTSSDRPRSSKRRPRPTTPPPEVYYEDEEDYSPTTREREFRNRGRDRRGEDVAESPRNRERDRRGEDVAEPTRERERDRPSSSQRSRRPRPATSNESDRVPPTERPKSKRRPPTEERYASRQEESRDDDYVDYQPIDARDEDEELGSSEY